MKENAKEQGANRSGVSSSLGINAQEGERAARYSPQLLFQLLSTKILGKLGGPHLTLRDDPDHLTFDRTIPVGRASGKVEGGIADSRQRSPFHQREQLRKVKSKDVTTFSRSLPTQKVAGSNSQYAASPSERGTIGMPFVRAPSRPRRSRSQSSQPLRQESGASNDSASEGEAAGSSRSKPLVQPFSSNRSESLHSWSDKKREPPACQDRSPRRKSKLPKAYMTVGISRLHIVELPELRVSKSQPAKKLG